MDILKESEWGSQPVFDVLVSNPPYVTQSEKSEMSANVLDYEPSIALFVSDDDPLIFYRDILNFATNHLKPGGSIYFEINRQFGRELIQLATDAGFRKIELRKDLSGNDRMLLAMTPYSV
jgi:release factor glutamine methyltransferase